MRPPKVWNFHDKAENTVPHVLRADVKPQDCYIDGRIEKVLVEIEECGHHLKSHESDKWNQLNAFTYEIFKFMRTEEMKEMKAKQNE